VRRRTSSEEGFARARAQNGAVHNISLEMVRRKAYCAMQQFKNSEDLL
jgi:hypothetical protein